jgi:hypothetical protein
MKRVVWIFAAILLCSVSAKAQEEVPAWEVSGGYSYLRGNFNSSAGFSSFNLNGGTAAVAENMNGWFGGRFELGAWSGTVGGITVNMQSFTFGPVFSYRKLGRLVPWGDFELGATNASRGYLGISKSAGKFALKGGGGVDFKATNRVGARVQADYLVTQYLGLREDNLALSAGIVVYLGSK